MEVAPEVVLFLTSVAFVAGLIDALAGGGGLLTIPALMASGVPPVAALATNKLQSAFGTAGAFVAFARKGHVDLRRFAWPAAAAAVSAGLGAFVVQRVNPSFLAAVVPALLISMAVYYLLAPKMGDEDRHSRAGLPGLLAVAGVIGFYDGFFGPGTGSFFTTALVTVGGLGLVRAIAHTKLLNLATNLASVVVMVAGGHVLWGPGLAMALANVAGNQLGAHLAMRFGGRGVRPLLVIMSLALTVKLLSDPVNPLRSWAGW